MAKASQVGKHTEDATVDVIGLIIKLSYYPDRFSPHIMRQFASLAAMQALFNVSLLGMEKKSADEIEQEVDGKLAVMEKKLDGKTGDLADILSTLIARWDFEEDEEESATGFVALTIERLVKFGFIFLFRLLDALITEMKLMGEKKGTISKTHSNGTLARRAR
jgi:hypothetical protein